MKEEWAGKPDYYCHQRLAQQATTPLSHPAAPQVNPDLHDILQWKLIPTKADYTQQPIYRLCIVSPFEVKYITAVLVRVLDVNVYVSA